MVDEIWNYLVSQLHTNQFFSGAALASVLWGIIGTLKSWPRFIWSRIYRYIHYSATIDQSTFLYSYMADYMATKYPSYIRRVEFLGRYDSTKKTGRDVEIQQDADTVYIWRNKRRLSIISSKEKMENSSDINRIYSKQYYISGYFAKKAIDSLIREIIVFGVEKESRSQKEKEVIRLYYNTLQSYCPWQLDKVTSSKLKSFDSIFLPHDLKEKIKADIDYWKEERVMYDKLSVPYKRGFLFYGDPGNGKSAVAGAIAEHLRYDIYSLSLSHLRDVDLRNVISQVPNNSVLLIEDIDSFYNGREQLGENKVTFSTFLNVLSGVSSADNIITIFTTNKLDTIDPALLRSSRCDVVIEIPGPSVSSVNDYLHSIFNNSVSISKLSSVNFADVQNTTLRNFKNIPNLLNELENGSKVSTEVPDIRF